VPQFEQNFAVSESVAAQFGQSIDRSSFVVPAS